MTDSIIAAERRLAVMDMLTLRAEWLAGLVFSDEKPFGTCELCGENLYMSRAHIEFCPAVRRVVTENNVTYEANPDFKGR